MKKVNVKIIDSRGRDIIDSYATLHYWNYTILTIVHDCTIACAVPCTQENRLHHFGTSVCGGAHVERAKETSLPSTSWSTLVTVTLSKPFSLLAINSWMCYTRSCSQVKWIQKTMPWFVSRAVNLFFPGLSTHLPTFSITKVCVCLWDCV